MMTDGVMSKGMQGRIDRVLNAKELLPGWYPLGKTPVPMW